MSYHIPTDDQVLSALKEVFSEYRTITTQHELRRIVERQLNKTLEDGTFVVSASRIRRLGIVKGIVDVKIDYREGDIKHLSSSCPVCGSRLKRVKNKTVFGGEVTIERRCKVCGYWMGKTKRIPARYIFYRKS